MTVPANDPLHQKREEEKRVNENQPKLGHRKKAMSRARGCGVLGGGGGGGGVGGHLMLGMEIALDS